MKLRKESLGMPISMREVATRAGVSESTVSLVLSDKKGTRVAVETQQRVREIAKEMNYRPNSFARSIARQKTDTLRLICSSHDNPFFVRATKAVDINTRVMMQMRGTVASQKA